MSEQFSWVKFFSGLVDPTAYFKTIAVVLRIVFIVLILWGGWVIGNFIHQKLSPKKQQPVIFTTTGQIGGETKNSADQKKLNFGLFNF